MTAGSVNQDTIKLDAYLLASCLLNVSLAMASYMAKSIIRARGECTVAKAPGGEFHCMPPN